MGIQGGNFEKPFVTFEESLEFIVPEAPFKNPEFRQRKDPLDFLKDYFKDPGVTEQNQEVMGPKEQMFPRYANPDDGTLNNEEMARVDPTDKLLLDSLRRGEIGPVTDPRIRKAIIDLERKIYNDGRASSMEGALMAEAPGYGPEIPQSMVGDVTERISPGYKARRDALRQRIAQMRLRGV